MDPREDIRALLEREAQERRAMLDSGRILRWEDIPTAADLPDQKMDWLVEGMIPAGGITLLAGESGTYKTWLALVLARSAAGGLEFLGRKCRVADVLYLDRENPCGLMRKRLVRLSMENLTGVRLWGGWAAEAPPLIGDTRLAELARERRPLMIFDSFIRFHEQDENSATMMALVMGELRLLANAGATVVVLHHKPKGDGSQYRGSSDIRAGVDVAFAVSAAGYAVGAGSSRPLGAAPNGDEGPRLLKFICFKNRLAPEFALTLRPELCAGACSGSMLEGSAGDRLPGFAVVEPPAASRHSARHSDDVAKLCALISAHPGLSQTQVVSQCAIPHRKLLTLLKACEGQWWRVQKGAHGALLYYPLQETQEISGSAQ